MRYAAQFEPGGLAALLKQLDALCPDASVTLELSSCRKSVEWLVRQNLLEE